MGTGTSADASPPSRSGPRVPQRLARPNPGGHRAGVTVGPSEAHRGTVHLISGEVGRERSRASLRPSSRRRALSSRPSMTGLATRAHRATTPFDHENEYRTSTTPSSGGAVRGGRASAHGAFDQVSYSIRRPLIALEITSCWICSVPSKMSMVSRFGPTASRESVTCVSVLRSPSVPRDSAEF